jgi:hypothetical protein
LLVLTMAACGDDTGSGDTPGTGVNPETVTPAPPDGPVADGDRELVETYITQMASGDGHTALDVWCDQEWADRWHGHDNFAAGAADAARHMGVSAVAESRVDAPDAATQQRHDGRNPVMVTYRLDRHAWAEPEAPHTSGRAAMTDQRGVRMGADDLTLAAIVVDAEDDSDDEGDPGRCIAEFTSPRAAQLQEEFEGQLTDLGAADVDALDDLIPDLDPALPYEELTTDEIAAMGAGTSDLEPLPPDDQVVDDAVRFWRHEVWGGVTISVVQFESDDTALRAARASFDHAVHVVHVVGLPDVPGAAGIQHLSGYAHLGIQPPDAGPYLQVVSLVFDDVVVDVRVNGDDLDAGAVLAGDLARESAALAGH